jgi:hypothetical protein
MRLSFYFAAKSLLQSGIGLLLWVNFSPAFATEFTAQSCPTIDLEARGETAAGIPTANQGRLPACYSFNASFLASVWARTEWSTAEPEYGHWHDLPFETYDEITHSPEYNEILDAQRGRTCQAIEFILRRERGKFTSAAAAALTLPECEMYGLVKNKNLDEYDLLDPALIEQHMHQKIMAAHALPIGIEYCAGVHHFPNQDFIVNRVFRDPISYLNEGAAALENFDYRCGFHSTSIVGQQLQGDQCFFKIRNTNTKYVWVESGALARNTLRVISMRRP